MRNAIMEAVKGAIRQGYSWPGGYELFSVQSDGAVLCTACLRRNYRSVSYDTRHGDKHTGWAVSGISCGCDIDGDPVYCDACGKDIGI